MNGTDTGAAYITVFIMFLMQKVTYIFTNDKNITGLLTNSYDITSPYDVDSDTGFSLSLDQIHSPLI